jgi:signal transduction histidine kinase
MPAPRSRSSRRQTADVTALVGHELSAPIATALLYIRIAECHCAAAAGRAPNGLARAALGVARAEVQKLKRLIDRVIEIERNGRAIVHADSVDLGAVVASTVERVLAAVADAALRDSVRVDVPRGFIGWWDDAAVEEMVRNLLSNALKFGAGRPIRVSVRAAPDGARISVQDEGPGVRAADRDRIFERHARASVAEGGGLGLGLWLARELAVAHGGGVSVQSSAGQGSTFVVDLPELLPPVSRSRAEPRPRSRAESRRAAAAADQWAATQLWDAGSHE